MRHRGRVLTAASVLLCAGALGCGGHNKELSQVHREGPNCIMAGCHPSAGAGGTVYTEPSGSAPLADAVVEAQEGGRTMTLGRTDSLGNFLYRSPLQGGFIMAANGITSNATIHFMPGFKECNTCHVYPPEPGALGRIFGGTPAVP